MLKKILTVFLTFILLIGINANAAFDMSSSNSVSPAKLSDCLQSAITLDLKTKTAMYAYNINNSFYIDGDIVRLATAYTAYSIYSSIPDKNERISRETLEALTVRLFYSADPEGAARELALSFYDNTNDFINQMNTIAAGFEMASTKFVNVDGSFDNAQVSTAEDMAKFVYGIRNCNFIRNMLSSNIYYTSDRKQSYSRSIAVLDAQNKNYNPLTKFFVSSSNTDKFYVCLSIDVDTSGRDIAVITCHSGATAVEYSDKAMPDMLSLCVNSYGGYYLLDVSNVAKYLCSKMKFELSNGEVAYVSIELMFDDNSYATLPQSEAVTITDDNNVCTIQLASEEFPPDIKLNDIITSASLVYNGKTLMKMNLRVNKIEKTNGSFVSNDYIIYNVDDYNQQIEMQYNRNGWITYSVVTVILSSLAVGISYFVIKRNLL